MADQPPLIEVRDLRIRFGSQQALDGLALSLGPGTHGLLGPNGAGKSTLIKILLALLRPDSGSGSVLCRPLDGPPRAVRHRIGYMPERDCHVPGMTAIDYVALMGELSGLPRTTATRRAHEVLTYVGLPDSRYRILDGFSAGMRQRAKLAAALVHDPELLLLDEPTNGLDPSGRRDMIRLVLELKATGVNILLSTHLLPDVEEVCDGVAVLSKGRVVRTGTVEELRRSLDTSWRLRITGNPDAFVAGLAASGATATVDAATGEIRCTLPEGGGTRLFIEAAVRAEAGIRVLQRSSRSLEEAFLEIVESSAHADP